MSKPEGCLVSIHDVSSTPAGIYPASVSREGGCSACDLHLLPRAARGDNEELARLAADEKQYVVIRESGRCKALNPTPSQD